VDVAAAKLKQLASDAAAASSSQVLELEFKGF